MCLLYVDYVSYACTHMYQRTHVPLYLRMCAAQVEGILRGPSWRSAVLSSLSWYLGSRRVEPRTQWVATGFTDSLEVRRRNTKNILVTGLEISLLIVPNRTASVVLAYRSLNFWSIVWLDDVLTRSLFPMPRSDLITAWSHVRYTTKRSIRFLLTSSLWP